MLRSVAAASRLRKMALSRAATVPHYYLRDEAGRDALATRSESARDRESSFIWQCCEFASGLRISCGYGMALCANSRARLKAESLTLMKTPSSERGDVPPHLAVNFTQSL